MGCLFIFMSKILIKRYFQDKIGSNNHSFEGDFLNIRLLTLDDAPLDLSRML